MKKLTDGMTRLFFLILALGVSGIVGCKEQEKPPSIERQMIADCLQRLGALENKLNQKEIEFKEMADVLAKKNGLEFYVWVEGEDGNSGFFYGFGTPRKELRLRTLKPRCDYEWNEKTKQWRQSK